MGNSLVTQVESLRGELEKRKETIFAAAAQHIRPERFLEQVARACIKTPKLLDCSRASLFISAAQAASLGLEIDGVLGHAYLVPFGNEATLVPGYLGLKELAYRSGMIASIEMAAVYVDDEFEYERGTSPFVKHKPSDSSANGTPTHVYAIVKTTLGGTIFDVMSWAQVEKHRNKFSKGYNRSDSSWQTNPVAMALKTVMRKALKLAPLSAELQRMMQHEEYAEQPLFPSGTEAPVEDLDAAAELLDTTEHELRPSDPTPEELADWEREKVSAGKQSDIPW
jgi:recombination protein RecT